MKIYMKFKHRNMAFSHVVMQEMIKSKQQGLQIFNIYLGTKTMQLHKLGRFIIHIWRPLQFSYSLPSREKKSRHNIGNFTTDIGKLRQAEFLFSFGELLGSILCCCCYHWCLQQLSVCNKFFHKKRLVFVVWVLSPKNCKMRSISGRIKWYIYTFFSNPISLYSYCQCPVPFYFFQSTIFLFFYRELLCNIHSNVMSCILNSQTIKMCLYIYICVARRVLWVWKRMLLISESNIFHLSGPILYPSIVSFTSSWLKILSFHLVNTIKNC